MKQMNKIFVNFLAIEVFLRRKYVNRTLLCLCFNRLMSEMTVQMMAFPSENEIDSLPKLSVASKDLKNQLIVIEIERRLMFTDTLNNFFDRITDFNCFSVGYVLVWSIDALFFHLNMTIYLNKSPFIQFFKNNTFTCIYFNICLIFFVFPLVFEEKRPPKRTKMPFL